MTHYLLVPHKGESLLIEITPKNSADIPMDMPFEFSYFSGKEICSGKDNEIIEIKNLLEGKEK